MVYIELTWYKDVFGGKIVPDDEFDHMARLASDVVDMVALLEITPEIAQKEQVKKATAYEMELLYQQGGDDAVNGNAEAFGGSESLDRYSYNRPSNDVLESAMDTVDGIPFSPIARRLLFRAGVMTSNVYAGCYDDA